MAAPGRNAVSTSVVLSCLLATLLLAAGSSSAQLSTGFYASSCPELLDAVRSALRPAVARERRVAASILRLFFHDCFVQGCDGSLLLDDASGLKGEKNAAPNKDSARGFDVVDAVKAAVEKACPGVVSCADVLAASAMEGVALLGGPRWKVKMGRRDSTTASFNGAENDIPPPTSGLANLTRLFAAKGLSQKDMVALSGAHTIGLARCTNFRDHIYNDTDIDAGFAGTLQQRCPRATGSGDNNLAPLDLQTPNVFENAYYKNLVAKKSLLHSDQELFNGGAADAQVREYVGSQSAFFADFVEGMVKMGDVTPLTGSNGQIRKNCRRVN
ncbi:peroxidase 4 [Brachypodium distachyon]|uniref:Peroxidase n=1 Tax=Brachypodium distachyon TaxID=15368 RepID=I1INI8_BRADI|nr:peroxidase 4 [Brachypodium distachyon]KQJ89434.1 hypothetical protein BRADI_4g25660v3 [Brachypodium distachyon]|eukprot:XP_003577842.1 peroxidase 4 [Brachypodium distachyon]